MLIPSVEPDFMLFRSVYGYNNAFRASDWQAFVPDIIPDRKSTSVGSRVIAREDSNKFHPGTIVYIDRFHVNCIVDLDGGGYWFRTITQLRILLPGFTGKLVFHLGLIHTHTHLSLFFLVGLETHFVLSCSSFFVVCVGVVLFFFLF